MEKAITVDAAEARRCRKRRAEAIDRLASWDHAILYVDAAREVAEALGASADCVPVRRFTGEQLYSGKANDGVDAAELARAICDALEVPYVHQHGRGSQLRMCITALREEEASYRK